jgi:glycosyltransferase involved in cell wall biosynthesis
VGEPPSPLQAVLLCGLWPHPRVAVFTLLHDLIAVLNRLGRPVFVLCDGYGVRGHLGPEAICLLEIPADEPFDWDTAFCAKRLYPSLRAFLAEDGGRSPSLLATVGILHSHYDQFIQGLPNGRVGRELERELLDYLTERTGHRPRLVRTRHEDLQGNLDLLMRLTGIDYVARGRAERERILNGNVDWQPLVEAHVRRHGDQLRSWGWDEAFQAEAIHHVWWRLHQLARWRDEANHFDAVVCLTRAEVDRTRDLLLVEEARTLTCIHSGCSFAPRNRTRMRRLLDGYLHQESLLCWHGAEDEPGPAAPLRACKRVVFVGRPHPGKGSHELAQSLRDLYHSGRRELRGILVGDFSPEERRELAALDPEHCREYLLFPGWVEDLDVLAALFAVGDVTALPSHTDTAPLVGMESYRMGTPCVVTEDTGAGELYLTNPHRHGSDIARPVRRRHADGIARYYGVDVASLTAELAAMLDHPAEARRMGEDGERFVRQHYSVERMGARYHELYNHLLAGEPADRLRD